ncbi:multidrug efflux RND transporter permease subunit [Iodidimonas sp. SYSU 1G8]|uniref:multidrug efflux RND transporter permease subunit n=1 Tax=Iodidimonas sp. SYSU 1G8 TaxID=3133967 RepID=UPI0031FE9D28
MTSKTGLSIWFIRHPIATFLLSLAVVALGLVAFPQLPIAPLPQAEFPTLSISARLPGASPETMASAVATPLESELSSVPGITEMTSTSALGSTSITLQFALTKDIDTAAQEVQAAINSVSGRLPADMPSLPTWRKVNPADAPVLILSVQSKLMPLTELSDLADTLINRQISQIDGVGEIFFTGQKKPAMRIQASPEKLAGYGLTMADLRGVIQRASVNQAKGAIYGADRVSTIETNDQIFDPEEYERLPVAYRDGRPILLGSVAKVTFGAENDYVQAWQYGEPGVNFIIRRQPDANIVATVDRIMAALPAIRASLPASVEVEVLNDRTRTIRSTLHEVEITLGVTAVLVVLVMGLFLRQLSATLIVGAVLGVALVSTCAAMFMLGFSLNNLTLVALVIAVGFIVDDAIVVIENIHRHLEAGESMLQAAIKGSAEIGFTVISISFSLIAAFIPLLFMGGIVGRLFSEFALTVTAAILLSVVASLTLAPMLASRFMKALPHQETRKDGFSEKLLKKYERGITWVLAHQRTMLVVFGITVSMAIASYVFVPKGFFPLQDTGFVFGTTQAADDVSYDDMVEKHKQLAEIVGKDPAILRFGMAVGPTAGSTNLANGRFFIVLKDPGDRDVDAEEFIARLRPQVSQIPGIQLILRSAQDINIGAGFGKAQYLYVLRGNDSDELGLWANRLTERLSQIPGLTDVSNDLQMGAAVTRLTIDRTAAARFGITAEDIDQVLYDAYGQRQISEFQTEINQYKVILEISPEQRASAQSLDYFYLRSPLTGQMVPLSSIATVEPPEAGPVQITHDGMFPSVNVSFNLAKGTALGDAVKLVEEAQIEMGMPTTITGSFRGSAEAFQSSLASQPFLILAALLAVYIILGVLYESFVHPLTILSTLPSAGIGAILFLWVMGFDFSIMAMIGLVLLIGIVKKNGILMIDFALDAQRTRGLPPEEAIKEACLVRFRPIMMTSIAAAIGAVPLMLGLGTGSELRQPLGIAVIGGLLVSQALTLFSTPVIYLTLDRLFHGADKRTDPTIGTPQSLTP